MGNASDSPSASRALRGPKLMLVHSPATPSHARSRVAHGLTLRSLSMLGAPAAMLGAGAERTAPRRMGIGLPHTRGPRRGGRPRTGRTRCPRRPGFGFLDDSAPSAAPPARQPQAAHGSGSWSTRRSSTASASQHRRRAPGAHVERAAFRGCARQNIGKNFDTRASARPTTTSNAWTRCTTTRPT